MKLKHLPMVLVLASLVLTACAGTPAPGIETTLQPGQPAEAPTPEPTATPMPTPIPVTHTPTSELPTNTPLPPTPTPVPPTATLPPAEPILVITAVDKRAEYVDIQNIGGASQDLSGWHLLSEKGAQDCPLAGIIEAGETLRIWAQAQDSDKPGFNCGYETPIWNNSERDHAVLLDAAGSEVDRK